MTIEQKAKAFDEAYKVAENIHRFSSDPAEIKRMEEIFPELKESEDEKIRKGIIAIIHLYYGEPLEDEAKEMISWLEKQGEKEKDILEDAILDGNEDGLIAETIRYKNEKQGEQNTADKIEPKFHEGEWLCENVPNNYARFIQILEIVNVQGKDRYRISRDIHNDEDIVEFDFVEKYYHKFDIQDAKDGDVLSYVTEEENLWIMIYWSLYEPYEGHVHYHALLVNDNFSDKGTCCICIDDLKPATKEQRDLLFQKMKEAGYEWDAEKKELKKIEQKPAWSEEDEEALDMCINAIPKAWKTKSGILLTKWLKKRFYQQSNQKWDKKDSEIMDELIYELNQRPFLGSPYIVKFTDWLKSLKDRYTWKPSDEQIKSIKEAACYSSVLSEKTINNLISLSEQLKKLKY